MAAQAHFLRGAAVLREFLDRLHLKYRATRPLGLVARDDDVDVVQTADTRERREVALKTINGRCDVRELDDFARRQFHVEGDVGGPRGSSRAPMCHPRGLRRSRPSSSGLPVLRSLKMTSSKARHRRPLGTGADPVELVEALRIGDAEEPRTRRVVEGDGRVHRLGELAVLGVGVLLPGNGDAPVEEELSLRMADRLRRGA